MALSPVFGLDGSDSWVTCQIPTLFLDIEAVILTCPDGFDDWRYGSDGVGKNGPYSVLYLTAISKPCVGDPTTTVHWTIWYLPSVSKSCPIGVVGSHQRPCPPNCGRVMPSGQRTLWLKESYGQYFRRRFSTGLEDETTTWSLYDLDQIRKFLLMCFQRR